jgi:hypothetical protein
MDTPPHVSILFETHSWMSNDVILDLLVQCKLILKELSDNE